MKLTGIELQNFRSIGSQDFAENNNHWGVHLNPLRKCNILVGKNNVGKSNVIKAIQKISAYVHGQSIPLEDVDLHKRQKENPFLFSLIFQPDHIEDEVIQRLAKIEEFDFFFSWAKGQSTQILDHTFARVNDFDQANELLWHLSGSRWPKRVNSDVIRRDFLESAQVIFARHFAPNIPNVYVIPEFRQIRKGNDSFFSGSNLIEVLAQYQHPPEGMDHLKDKFEQIQEFVRRLLHLPKAKLEVTHEKDRILLDSGLRHSLEYYGTGVHQLVILVTAVLAVENSICCIEEPEIHLHPTLQREFIQFIAAETSNQYLISTHSPTLINAHTTFPSDVGNQVQVFHLYSENGSTIGRPVLVDTHGLIALSDLGAKASDILQANSVIWVEGPSDKIYVNHWLKLLEPKLIEGLHYSIMFYGGRLLSHLSVERNYVPEELIDVLRINQHAIVIMDSDKEQSRGRVNATKRRIEEECHETGSLCWITDGREIENYLPVLVIKKTCESLVDKSLQISFNSYDKLEESIKDACKLAKVKGFDYSANKVEFARKFVEHFELTDMTDILKKQVEEVISKIKEWNK